MSSSLPRISAAGLYDINCQLIPTVILYKDVSLIPSFVVCNNRRFAIYTQKLTIYHVFLKFSKFVGTTLTYLIILNQFDSAERSTSDTNISATSQ